MRHRDDGAMGIVNQAEEIDFGQLLAQLDIVPETEAIRLPPAPKLYASAVRRDEASFCIRATTEASDSTVKIGEHTNRHARHPAGDRRGTGPSRAVLALVTPAGPRGQLERDPRQRLALPAPPMLASSSIPISTVNTIRRSRSSASMKGCCPRRRPRLRPSSLALRRFYGDASLAGTLAIGDVFKSAIKQWGPGRIRGA